MFIDSRNILYHFKAINWIGTHWRVTRRRSPVKGVNSVNNFCVCDSFLLFSSLICCFLIAVQFAFHFSLQLSFNYVKCCFMCWANWLWAFIKLFNAHKLRSDRSAGGLLAPRPPSRGDGPPRPRRGGTPPLHSPAWKSVHTSGCKYFMGYKHGWKYKTSKSGSTTNNSLGFTEF